MITELDHIKIEEKLIEYLTTAKNIKEHVNSHHWCHILQCHHTSIINKWKCRGMLCINWIRPYQNQRIVHYIPNENWLQR